MGQREGGASRKVACLSEGDVFGEQALLSNGPRMASVVASTRTVVFELTRAQVERIAQLHPSVAQMLRSFYQVRLLANMLRGNSLLFSPSLNEGDLFGELSVLLGLPATASVIADTSCTLLRLERADVERFIATNTGLREALFHLSSERLQRTAQLVVRYDESGSEARG